MSAATCVALCPALVVDADPVGRRRMQDLVRRVAGPQALIAAVADVDAARTHLASRPIALAVVDTGLSDGSGIDLIRWVHGHCPQTSVLVVSACGSEEAVLAALRAGAVGYLLNERDDIELELALKSVRAGGSPIDPVVARRILGALIAADPARPPDPARTPDLQLSKREAEVLDLVARGYSNREVAEITCLSRFTVEGHIKKVYRKLSVGSRTAAVFEAKAMGLLQ